MVPLNTALLRLKSAAESFIDNMGRSTPPKQPQPRKKSARRRLYDLHAWVGYHLAVIMVVVLATGSFATIADELDWLAQHDMRVMPKDDQVSWEEMVDAIKNHAPDATIASITKGEAPYFAYRAAVIDRDGLYKYIHVNQWTGHVTGETGTFTFQYFFRNLHRYLFLPKVFGLTIVSSMAVILAISLYTGLKTSRNWRTLMTRVRLSKGIRTTIGDAHKAVGLWSIWFFILIIITGFWYYAEFLGKNFEPTYSRLSEETVASYPDVLIDPSVSDVVNTAQSAYPELNITRIAFGVTDRQPIMVDGRNGNPIIRQRANRVYLDPMTLDIIRVQRSQELGWLQWTNQIVDPLHFGSFGGLPIKLIWFVFGLFMTGLSASGVWLAWRRLKVAGASGMQLGALPIMLLAAISGSVQFASLQLPISGGFSVIGPLMVVIGLFLLAGSIISGLMFARRWRISPRLSTRNTVCLVLTCAAAGGGIFMVVSQKPFAPSIEMALGTRIDGPVRADLFLATDPDGTPTGDARMIISTANGRLNTRDFSVRLRKDDDYLEPQEDRTTKRLSMQTHSQTRYFKLSRDDLSKATDIEADVTMLSGNIYRVAWDLP
ncbi:MAG: PepSY-associated TM helix domain-containing protein [Pseudomonadota bacterium]